MIDNFEEDIKNKLLKKDACVETKINDYMDLLSPTNISKNAFYFETLTDNEFFDFSGLKNDFVEFYKKIVKTRVGLIILGGAYLGIGEKNVNNVSRITIDENIMSKYKEVVKIAHTTNCKIFLKVKSVFGRNNELYNINKSSKIASNFGIDSTNKQRLLIRASDDKCNQIVQDFARHVMLSNIAGFDGIVIDATINNLIGELSNDAYNKRIFGYYSDTKDLLTKMLKSMHSSNNTIILKLSITQLLCNNLKNAKHIQNFQKTADEFKDTLKYYISLGVDGFEFIFGNEKLEFLNKFNSFEEEYLFNKFVTSIRDYFNSNNIKNKFNENVVILYHDNFNNLSKANTMLKNNTINFLDITKNIYSDAKFIKNLINKKRNQNCIKCSYCDKKAQFNLKNDCLINLTFFNSSELVINGNNKTVAIVGSGISGIYCALTLASRGFIVYLFEQKTKLNHTGKLTTVFGFDSLLLNFYEYMEEKINHFIKQKKIVLFLNQKFDLNNFEFKNFYSIIIATGFNKKFLSITGAVQPHVQNIYDALENEKLFLDKHNIVLYVKSALSLKLALWICKQNKNITLIIKNVDWINNDKNANLFYYFWNLYNFHANIYYLSRITKINQDNIDLIFNKNLNNKSIESFYKIISNEKIKQEQRQINLDCDLLIYEPDTTPNNKLYIDIVKEKYRGEVYLIGNALENGDLSDIIKSGYFVGKNL